MVNFAFIHISGMQILGGGGAQLFEVEVEHFGGEASPALPPLNETLMTGSYTATAIGRNIVMWCKLNS